ncbi:MAG: hypothetical protein IJ310_01455 [Clostridia bacterium]|nr:hypothetical protein [Clostridia bacterium]
MAKRFTTVFFVTLAIAVLCVAIFTLVLFMAPGMSVFGLKYISTNTHVVSERFKIADALKEELGGGDFSGSIRVETEDVPVNVVFTQGWQYEIVYYDNYSGLTTSKFDDPSIAVSRDNDGTAVIKVTSFKKFIYENANSTRYLTVMIPAVTVSTTLAGQTDFTVKANNASVSFSDEKADNFDPYFHQITIETAGGVGSSINLKADTYSLTTLNSINIGSDTAAAINASNYILKSTGGNIVVNRDVPGNIDATTNNASIKILSCENFTASSGWGDISCVDKEKDITIRGKANITTSSGKVALGSINGGSDVSYITTKTGSIDIKKALDAELTTTRGHVKVNSARNVKVTTSSGSITLEESTASANLATKRGKVTVGGENSVVKNPTVVTTYGKVFVNAASGKVYVETTKANVEFKNRDAEDITLKIGGKLTADKLKGKVDITVEGASTISFETFTEDSKITNNGSGYMTINLLSTKVADFAYSMEGTEVKLMEYNEEDPANHRQVAVPASIVTGGNLGQPKLTVKSGGSMVVYCKMV